MDWKIPLSDIDFGQDEIDAVLKVLKSKWLTMGAVTQDFEKEFSEYLGAKYAFAVSNCTAALHIACSVLGIGNGDEVIVPSLTFVATANSILYTGATPVFADITGLDDLTISPDSILERITPKTRAIIVMHYGGYPCNMQQIMQIAKEHNIYVIEDAAHAHGAEYGGKKCGSIGDIGCFSFFSNKNMVCGEGGMVVTSDDKLAEKIKRIRSHGMTSVTWDRHKGHAYSYDVVDLGYNYRIDEIRSSLGLIQLSKLDKNNRIRKQLSEKYVELLSDVEEIRVPFAGHRSYPHSYLKSAYHIFPVLLNEDSGSSRTIADRYKIMEKMKKAGIQTSIHYPPIHLFSYYQGLLNSGQNGLPYTEYVGQRELTLPLHPLMKDSDVQNVAENLMESLL